MEGEKVPKQYMPLPSADELYPLNEARLDFFGGYTTRKERFDMGPKTEFYAYRNDCAVERLQTWLKDRGYILEVEE